MPGHAVLEDAMLFNSIQFFVFFLAVYTLYLALGHKKQNLMLLVASYVFYGAWDWRFLSLIAISTVLDFVCARKIDETEDVRRRKLFLTLSVAGNLLILGFFKYYDFFAQNLQALLGRFGVAADARFLEIILPVGISFYTFQTMSYTIDVYRGEMRSTDRFLDFALFVAFFPQLVAGPIERAKRLLPQVLSPRPRPTLQSFSEGAFLIFWGLFQKVFIADNLANLVDPVFAADPPYHGAHVLVALYAFAFQILCDFAGYSNIARGLGRCLGFDIMVNFNAPYSAANPSEFWKRWHISLSSWLRDYLYIGLGGNRRGAARTYRNLIITMLLGGLWHGAQWTFILWGAYHGALLVLYRLARPVFSSEPDFPRGARAGAIWRALRVAFFFHLVCVGWLIFRADSVDQIGAMLRALFLAFPTDGAIVRHYLLQMAFFLPLLFVVEASQRRTGDAAAPLRWPAAARWALYLVMFYSIMLCGEFGDRQFIYFQF